MDLSAAIDAHVQWRVKLKAAITRGEQLDAATISQDGRCDLGKWLSGEGRGQFGSKPEFQKLAASHRLFHAAAAKVAVAANAGKTAEAESLLGGAFQTQSQDTVAAIQACRKVCK